MKNSIFQDSVFQNFVAEPPVATATQVILQRLIEREAIDQIDHDNAELPYQSRALVRHSYRNAVKIRKKARMRRAS